MDLAIRHHLPGGISVFKSSEADTEGLADRLNITNWDNLVFNSDNINDVYYNVLIILDDTVNKCIPTKTIRVRPNDKLFMNNKIRNKIRQRVHYQYWIY
jgi:hypothetical protein